MNFLHHVLSASLFLELGLWILMRIWQIQAYVKKKSLTKLAPLLKDGITDSNTGLCKRKKKSLLKFTSKNSGFLYSTPRSHK
jgi:hypothetical protein